jgi:hypothetical protein
MCNKFIKTLFLIVCVSISFSNAYGMVSVPPKRQCWDKDKWLGIKSLTHLEFDNPYGVETWIEKAYFCCSSNPQHFVKCVLCGRGISYPDTYKDEFLVNIQCHNNCIEITSDIIAALEEFGCPRIPDNPIHDNNIINFRIQTPNENIVREFFSVFSAKDLVPNSVIDILISLNQCHSERK